MEHNTDHKDKITLFNTVYSVRYLINGGEWVTEDIENFDEISLAKPAEFMEDDSYFLDIIIAERGKQDELVEAIDNYGIPKESWFSAHPDFSNARVGDFYF